MWITRVSIANPVFATMVMVALCVLGLFSYARLGVEQLPDVQPPVAFIDVAYPGASPDAVEREVSKPIEEGLNSIAGIKHITSRSFEGRSQTSVEFTLDADMARAMQDVRDRMAVVQGVFPKDAKTPTVARFNNDNSSPVVVAALLSAARSPRELSILADQTVARRLQRVEGVASVEVNGLARREVRIDLDPDRLRAYAITPAQVAAGLREAHSDQPVGLLSDATQDAILRVEGRVADPRQFADMVVAQRNGLPLRLADLGTVVEREREPESVARVNGQRAVNFNVFKQQDANTVATGEAIKGAIEELRKTLPADVKLLRHTPSMVSDERGEPINDGDSDANSNLSVDFGFVRAAAVLAKAGRATWASTTPRQSSVKSSRRVGFSITAQVSESPAAAGKFLLRGRSGRSAREVAGVSRRAGGAGRGARRARGARR